MRRRTFLGASLALAASPAVHSALPPGGWEAVSNPELFVVDLAARPVMITINVTGGGITARQVRAMLEELNKRMDGDVA